MHAGYMRYTALNTETGGEMKKHIFEVTALAMALSTAGCGTGSAPAETIDPSAHDGSEIVAQVSGDMSFDGGSWVDEKDENIMVMFTASAENSYTIQAYRGKTASSAESWSMQGSYDPSSGMLLYNDGDYCLLKMNPDGAETKENEAKTSGVFLKEADDIIRWHDDHLSEDRVLKFQPQENNYIEIRTAEGPFTVNPTFNPVLTDEQKKLFEQGVDGQIGVGYEPIQVLAEQTVNGTNYAYLAYGTYVLGKEPVSLYTVITINKKTTGEAELIAGENLDVNDVKTERNLDDRNVLGGWKIVDNDGAGITTDEADEALMNAYNGDYSGPLGRIVTIALLGTDEESNGTTYRFLVRATTEATDPEKAYYIADIFKGTDGACTVASESILDLTKYAGVQSE